MNPKELTEDFLRYSFISRQFDARGLLSAIVSGEGKGPREEDFQGGYTQELTVIDRRKK